MLVVTCPACGVSLKASESVLGRQVVCGKCRHKFVASAAAAAPSVGAADRAPGAHAPSPPARPASPLAGQPAAAGGTPQGLQPPPMPPPLAPPLAAPGGQAYPYPVPLRTSGYAVASLVLGICTLVTWLCYGIPALVCGILALVFANTARRAVHAGQAAPSSLGMAKAGKVCAWIGLSLAALFLVAILITVLMRVSRVPF